MESKVQIARIDRPEIMNDTIKPDRVNFRVANSRAYNYILEIR